MALGAGSPRHCEALGRVMGRVTTGAEYLDLAAVLGIVAHVGGVQLPEVCGGEYAVAFSATATAKSNQQPPVLLPVSAVEDSH